ncbi:MAG TPA: hypothetical protein VN704_08260 [Verrucomicrobiae bacterium]|nr:hypothetical protein [Verrucomicrobiae bacterium]
MSTKSHNSRDGGDSGDKSSILEDMDNVNSKETPNENNLIGFKEPFYYCVEHPKVQNTRIEEIGGHLKYSKEHSQTITTVNS